MYSGVTSNCVQLILPEHKIHLKWYIKRALTSEKQCVVTCQPQIQASKQPARVGLNFSICTCSNKLPDDNDIVIPRYVGVKDYDKRERNKQ